MFWTVISIAWPLLLLALIVRGQFKEKDIPSPTAPIIVGAVGVLVLLLNTWWLRLTPAVLGYLLASIVIGGGAGYIRARLSRVYVSQATGELVRYGGWAGAGCFVGGLVLHYLAEVLFLPAAPVLAYASALTVNVYIAATLGVAGVVYRARARQLMTPWDQTPPQEAL
jgi:hypothetical protein